MPDTLTPLTAALHAELCRLHDVQPEGYSLTGDYAALGDDAAKLAEVAQPYIDAAWEAGRKHGLKQAWKPHDGRVKQLEEEIEEMLVLEEANGRAFALKCERLRELEAEMDRLRDLLSRVTRMDYEGVDVYVHGDSWMTAWQGAVEDHADQEDAIKRAKELARETS
ncbi:hypothetical protein ABZ234_03865 [Nocardiopsis sp. NPDC006198]|uniref:hypothetical protein n=1 Tax=Nocardiopsis sp. NPDC006198 TaxID=3154472 RepID=UPI0033ADEFD7